MEQKRRKQLERNFIVSPRVPSLLRLHYLPFSYSLSLSLHVRACARCKAHLKIADCAELRSDQSSNYRPHMDTSDTVWLCVLSYLHFDSLLKFNTKIPVGHTLVNGKV